MRDRKRPPMIGLLGALIALCGWAVPANAGFAPSSGTNNFVGEFSAFLADFGPWNASHNNLPLLFLEATPSQDEPEALFVLWWMWMRSQGGAPSSPAATTGGPPPTSILGGTGDHSAEPPIGTVGSGSNGDGSSPNPGTVNLPPTGTVGSGSNGDGTPTPILGGGSGSQGNGGNLPILLPPLNPPSQSVIPADLPSPGNSPPGGGSQSSGGGLVSPSISSVPEPSSLALLGSGALGMLTYGWGRWRTARRGRGAR